MEKEGVFEKIFDRVMAFTGFKDIDFEMYPDFSKRFLITGKEEADIRSFFTEDLIQFLNNAKFTISKVMERPSLSLIGSNWRAPMKPSR